MLRFAYLIQVRRYIGLLLLSSTGGAFLSPVAAQTWPNRPLTMVVPYAPSGSTDLVARLIAPGLGAALGQPVLVENMAGSEALPAYRESPAAEFVPAALLVDQVMLLAVRTDLHLDGLDDF